MKIRGLTRRTLLERLGLGTAAGALLPYLPWLEATAEAQAAPRRVVFMISANGTVPAEWRPSGGAGGLVLGGRVLRELERHRSRVNIVTGLEVAIHRLRGGGNAHIIPHPQFLTCQPRVADDWNDASAPSIDQRIGEAIGAGTPFRTVQVGVGPAKTYSFKGPRAPDHPVNNPGTLLDRLFARAPQANGGVQPAGPSPRLRERQRLFALVRPQLETLEARLGSADRRRVQAHVQALSDVERQLVALEGKSGPVGRPNVQLPSNNGYGATMSPHSKIVAAALAADLTRVAVFHMGTSGDVGISLSFCGHNQEAHGMAHSSRNGGANLEARVANEVWKAQRFAELLDHLDGYREGDRTLLDNTLVVWVSPFAEGYHSLRNMPCAIGGLGGGRVRGGRLLDYPGRSTGDLFTSVANAVGVPLTSFGDARQAQEPLAGLVS